MRRYQTAPAVQRQVSNLDSAWRPFSCLAPAAFIGGMSLMVMCLCNPRPPAVPTEPGSSADAPQLWRMAHTLAVHPDGQAIVLGWSDGQFAELDGAAGWVARWTDLRGGAPDVECATALSRDGHTRVTGGADGSVRVCRNGRRSGAFVLDDAITSVACSADGRYAAATSNRSVVVWDTESQRPLLTARVVGSAIGGVTIADDARRIAVILGGDQVQVWDVPSATIVRTWRAAYHIKIARLSPDGCCLASSDQCGGLYIDEIATGRAVADDRSAGGALDPIVAMDFAPEGGLLACGWAQGRVQLWDVETGCRAGELTGHTGSVSALRFPENGTTLISTGSDALVRVWDLDTQGELERIGLREILPTRSGR